MRTKEQNKTGPADLHQTGVLLQLLLEPHKLTVPPPHTGCLGCEGFTVGLRRKKKKSIKNGNVGDILRAFFII